MILSTGPTGSGKSTSLYSILKKINQPDINIITLEDPVEYRMAKVRQIQLNRKAGMTFAGGLRSILRQDPDVIMVGEIRDAETAGISTQAALTGHKVLSTVHTNNAAGAITRLTDMGIEPFLVSSVLLVSFAQRLIRTNCPYCTESYRPPEEALIAWGLDKVENANFQRGRGCPQCLNTGYRGRTGIFEVLVNDETIQHMILEGRTAQEITKKAREEGKLRTLKDDAAGKVVRGITTLEEAASTVMV
jgi:type IV pilus assembly protein PilB